MLKQNMKNTAKLAMYMTTAFLACVGSLESAYSSETLGKSAYFTQKHDHTIQPISDYKGPSQLQDLVQFLQKLSNSSDHLTQEAALVTLKEVTQPGTPAKKIDSLLAKFNSEVQSKTLSESSRRLGQSEGLPEHEQKHLEVARELSIKAFKPHLSSLSSSSHEESKSAMEMLTKQMQKNGLAKFFEQEAGSSEHFNENVSKIQHSVQDLGAKLGMGSGMGFGMGFGLGGGGSGSGKLSFHVEQYNTYRQQAGLAPVSHAGETIEVSTEDVKDLFRRLSEKLFVDSIGGSTGDTTEPVSTHSSSTKKPEVPVKQRIEIFVTEYTNWGMTDEGEARRTAYIKNIFNAILQNPEGNIENLNQILRFLYENQNNDIGIGPRQAQFAKVYFETAEIHPLLKKLVQEFITQYEDYLESRAIGPAGENWNTVLANYDGEHHFMKYIVSPDPYNIVDPPAHLKLNPYIKGSAAIPLFHLLAKDPRRLMDTMSVPMAKKCTELLKHTPFIVIDALYYLFWKLQVKEKSGTTANILAANAFIRQIKNIHQEGESEWHVTPLPDNYDPFEDFFDGNRDNDFDRYWFSRVNDIKEILMPPSFNKEGPYKPLAEDSQKRTLNRDTFEISERKIAITVTSKEREPQHIPEEPTQPTTKLSKSLVAKSKSSKKKTPSDEDIRKEKEFKNHIKSIMVDYLPGHLGITHLEIKGLAKIQALDNLVEAFYNSQEKPTEQTIAKFLSNKDLSVFTKKDAQEKEKAAKDLLNKTIKDYIDLHIGKGTPVEVKGFSRKGKLPKLLSAFITEQKEFAKHLMEVDVITHQDIDHAKHLVQEFMAKQDLAVFEGEEKDVMAFGSNASSSSSSSTTSPSKPTTSPSIPTTPTRAKLTSDQIQLKKKIMDAIKAAINFAGTGPLPMPTEEQNVFYDQAISDLHGKSDSEIQQYVKVKQGIGELPWQPK
jgi:hypothetical protein